MVVGIVAKTRARAEYVRNAMGLPRDTALISSPYGGRGRMLDVVIWADDDIGAETLGALEPAAIHAVELKVIRG